MSSTNLKLSIKQYCRKRNFTETSEAISNSDQHSEVDLGIFFEKFFLYKFANKNKLSFTFKVNNNKSLLKKRLETLNEPPAVKNGLKKLKTKKCKEETPECFLLLLDELCIDRKNAKKFYENPKEWTYVKSDRLIFCTQRGMCSFSESSII